jgi:hypothetical protein
MELENMMPWEREVYTGLLIEHIKKEDDDMKREQQRNG